MDHDEAVGRTPSVVPYDHVPVAEAADGGGFEVRPFDAHQILAGVVAPSGVALAWTRADGETALRSHPTPGLLIVLRGSGELVGLDHRVVTQGDVLTIPAHLPYGFVNVGAGGLQALHVAFGEATDPTAPVTLKDVLSRNEERAERAVRANPFFLFLQNGELANRRKRALMRECIRVFSDAYQTFLFTRQATCRDGDYLQMFHQHFLEELGHNQLLKVEGDARIARDPQLVATSTWFTHQLFVLDNASKVTLNIAMETAGYHFHVLAKSVFAQDESSHYFDVHAEADELHKELGVELLRDQHPETYPRLRQAVDDGWDMIEAMMSRMAALVEAVASAE
ncbi:MAG TPA: cupin domain-containing protein [Polyangiaceae bacterium]|jgi:mannose-6-phosphate isomerase-like protein (cupin superfamily)